LAIILSSCGLYEAKQAKELNNLGLARSEKGDQAGAIAYFLQASAMPNIPDSDRSVYLENIGIQYDLDNVDSAKYYYGRAAQLCARNTYHWLFDMAEIDLLDGHTDKAIPLLQLAYDKQKWRLGVNNLLGVIYLGDYGKEFLDARKALKFNLYAYTNNKTFNTEFLLARNYYELNQMDRALALFEEAHNESPGITSATGCLIMVHQELGNDSIANSMMEELKTKDKAEYENVIRQHIKKGQHSLVWHR
jgi:tetratricopeptide (TPR) repeat protein